MSSPTRVSSSRSSSIGFLVDTWLGLALGVIMYAASRWFVRAEETSLSRAHGRAWTDYATSVKVPWL